MQKKWPYILFCALFLAICAVPVAGLALTGPSKAGANEVLAASPTLTRGGAVNWDYLSDLSGYLEDRFALRQQLITADAALTAAVLGESRTDAVVLGDDGWLYYADTLDDYRGASAMDERALYCAARNLSLMQEYAAAHGAAFLFTSPPNKNTLYPQWMPARYTRGDVAASNWRRLMPYLDAQGVSYCDLSAVLAAEAAPVYYKTDSHWDGYGSALAHDALMAALGGKAALAKEDFTTEAHLGDLYQMLYPAGGEMEQGRVLARDRTFQYLGAVRGPDDQTIRTESGGGMGSLLMFRDSFGNLLHQDLAESFSRATFSRAMPVRMDLLAGEGTVIFELVERNLKNLAEKPPVMEGIRRKMPEVTGEVEATITIERAESRDVPDWTVYTGTLDCAQMDADSPVYAVLDGVVYEASPTPTGFTLYAPPAETVEVLICCGGSWMRCE